MRYEAGFDITKAPRLWNRRNEKSPDGSRVENFLYGGHSLMLRERRIFAVRSR